MSECALARQMKPINSNTSTNQTNSVRVLKEHIVKVRSYVASNGFVIPRILAC